MNDSIFLISLIYITITYTISAFAYAYNTIQYTVYTISTHTANLRKHFILYTHWLNCIFIDPNKVLNSDQYDKVDWHIHHFIPNAKKRSYGVESISSGNSTPLDEWMNQMCATFYIANSRIHRWAQRNERWVCCWSRAKFSSIQMSPALVAIQFSVFIHISTLVKRCVHYPIQSYIGCYRIK